MDAFNNPRIENARNWREQGRGSIARYGLGGNKPINLGGANMSALKPNAKPINLPSEDQMSQRSLRSNEIRSKIDVIREKYQK